MMLPLPRTFYLTGRYRLRPAGELVVLQIEEATKYPSAPTKRWRDATPQDVMSMVSLDLTPARIAV